MAGHKAEPGIQLVELPREAFLLRKAFAAGDLIDHSREGAYDPESVAAVIQAGLQAVRIAVVRVVVGVHGVQRSLRIVEKIHGQHLRAVVAALEGVGGREPEILPDLVAVIDRCFVAVPETVAVVAQFDLQALHRGRRVDLPAVLVLCAVIAVDPERQRRFFGEGNVIVESDVETEIPVVGVVVEECAGLVVVDTLGGGVAAQRRIVGEREVRHG